jgi:hypothetical protein
MSGQHPRSTLTLVEHNPPIRALVEMPESTARCKIMVGRVVQFGFQRNIIVGVIPSGAVLQAKREISRASPFVVNTKLHHHRGTLYLER